MSEIEFDIAKDLFDKCIEKGVRVFTQYEKTRKSLAPIGYFTVVGEVVADSAVATRDTEMQTRREIMQACQKRMRHRGVGLPRREDLGEAVKNEEKLKGDTQMAVLFEDIAEDEGLMEPSFLEDCAVFDKDTLLEGTVNTDDDIVMVNEAFTAKDGANVSWDVAENDTLDAEQANINEDEYAEQMEGVEEQWVAEDTLNTFENRLDDMFGDTDESVVEQASNSNTKCVAENISETFTAEAWDFTEDSEQDIDEITNSTEKTESLKATDSSMLQDTRKTKGMSANAEAITKWVSSDTQEHTVRASVEESAVKYTDSMPLCLFLRLNPSIRKEEEVLKWYTRTQIREAVANDEVLMKKGKFIL